MSGIATPPGSDGLAAKIARLVEERGWNQEDFARITKLNRQTIRQILLNQGRKPHNATVQCTAGRALQMRQSLCGLELLQRRDTGRLGPEPGVVQQLDQVVDYVVLLVLRDDVSQLAEGGSSGAADVLRLAVTRPLRRRIRRNSR